MFNSENCPVCSVPMLVLATKLDLPPEPCIKCKCRKDVGPGTGPCAQPRGEDFRRDSEGNLEPWWLRKCGAL